MKMQVIVKKVGTIESQTNSVGKTRRYRSVLLDYQDGIHAEWKYLGDEVIKPEDITVGMTAEMRVSEKGTVTIFEKV